MKQTQNQFYGKKEDLPNTLPKGSTYIASNSNEVYFAGDSGIPALVGNTGLISQEIQGYYAVLTDYYFTGDLNGSTETLILDNEVDQWKDVGFQVNTAGEFDKRPLSMKEAQPNALEGSGTQADPFLFLIEGLDQNSFVGFRASLAFEPEDDEGQFEARLDFERHSETTPNDNFPIEQVVMTMSQGADKEYSAEPYLTFFVGDTIDTNGVGDAGKCKFQVKSSVAGTLKMRALTWFINK